MSWRSQSGAYLLFIRLDRQIELQVGKLGKFHLEPGVYIYVGSAMGGFGRRIPRYLSAHRKVKWHIDYLLEKAHIIGVLLIPSEERIEEEIAFRLARTDGILESIRGFGASDSRNRTHLFRVKILIDKIGTPG